MYILYSKDQDCMQFIIGLQRLVAEQEVMQTEHIRTEKKILLTFSILDSWPNLGSNFLLLWMGYCNIISAIHQPQIPNGRS